MNPVKKMSIGGYAFTMESEAVDRIGEYFSELKEHYKDIEGGSEIMEGIEERMAELLIERCGTSGVVTTADASAVMETLGKPEKIEEESDMDEGNANGLNTGSPRMPNDERPAKKLYRDVENGKFLGVCSGLGAYFNIDVVTIRAIFVIVTAVFWFTFGRRFDGAVLIPILIYLILGFITPAAKTVKEKHRMKGEGNTVQEIQKSVENSFREASGAIREIGNSDAVKGAGNFILKTCGVILFILGFCGLFAGGIMIIWDQMFGFKMLPDRVLFDIIRDAPVLYATLQMLWVKCIICLAYFLPFTGMIYGGIQLLFGFKSPKWHPGMVIFLLWLMVLTMLAVLVAVGCLHVH